MRRNGSGTAMDLDLCEGIELGDLDELDEEEKADAMSRGGACRLVVYCYLR